MRLLTALLCTSFCGCVAHVPQNSAVDPSIEKEDPPIENLDSTIENVCELVQAILGRPERSHAYPNNPSVVEVGARCGAPFPVLLSIFSPTRDDDHPWVLTDCRDMAWFVADPDKLPPRTCVLDIVLERDGAGFQYDAYRETFNYGPGLAAAPLEEFIGGTVRLENKHWVAKER